MQYRTIGVGTMGLADYLAREFMIYDESMNDIDELLKKLYSIKSSALLAKDREYPMFKGSMWDRGLFFQQDKEWYIKIQNMQING